jgi:DNA-directed RNA polymerase subunit RPC12/RpoP
VTVVRWCRRCGKLYEAAVSIERRGEEEIRDEAPCPRCGGSGERLIGASPR